MIIPTLNPDARMRQYVVEYAVMDDGERTLRYGVVLAVSLAEARHEFHYISDRRAHGSRLRLTRIASPVSSSVEAMVEHWKELAS